MFCKWRVRYFCYLFGHVECSEWWDDSPPHFLHPLSPTSCVPHFPFSLSALHNPWWSMPQYLLNGFNQIYVMRKLECYKCAVFKTLFFFIQSMEMCISKWITMLLTGFNFSKIVKGGVKGWREKEKKLQK